MRSSLLFLLSLFLGFSSLSSVVQGQNTPALPLAGPHRPPGVPANYVITPFGYFHPSCVVQLNKGEHLSKQLVLRRRDGSETQIPACMYPHFGPSGTPPAKTEPSNEGSVNQSQPVPPPTISHSWIESSYTTTNSSYGEEVSTWTVPPTPLEQDGEVIYFFPGLEDINDSATSILQPVLGSYDGGQWNIASWNCCISGVADESTPVNVAVGDKIVGTTEMTCATGTTNCATWNVITEDQTTGQSTELPDTPADGQIFNWGFGGVLEVYYVDQCLDYPPNASLTMTSLLYDTSKNQIASPTWTDWMTVPADAVPQCNYGVTATATQTTLTYGTTGPGFGLGVQPAAGIAVNQGGSASGTITITDINGFAGAVDVVASNVPAGITAQVTQGSTPNTFTLQLTASSTVALTGAQQPAVMMLTASASGVATQTFPVNVIVNPPLMGGGGTPVDLTSAYNMYGFFNDFNLNAIYSGNSLDNAGDAYSANQLSPPGAPPMGLNFNGIQFSFGIPGQENAVYGTGANPITLPNGQFATLQILATGFDGSQKSQILTVTYSDNSTQTFTQTFDDWSAVSSSCTSSSPCAAGESVALTMPYVDTWYIYSRNDSIFYLYDYSLALNSQKAVKSLTLPINRSVVVLAATLLPIPESFALTNSGNVTVVAGQSGNARITVTPAGGFTGAVTFTCSSFTAGSCGSASATVTGTSAVTASLPISTSSGSAAGTYPIKVTGKNSTGKIVATTSFNLIVNPVASFVLSNGGDVTVVAGQSSKATITVTPAGGFTGAVTFTCSSFTVGSCGAASATVTGSSLVTASLPISTSAGSAAGTYPITVTGTDSTGKIVAKTSFNLIVNVPTFALSNSGNLSVAAGSTSGNTATITVSPAGGFTGQVNLSCSVSTSISNPNEPPTCRIPASVTISGSAATATLAVNTTASTHGALAFPMKKLFLGGGAALALLVFFGIPARRFSRLGGFMLLAFLSVSLIAGCGGAGSTGSGGGGGGGTGNPGTTAGSYTVTVNGTDAATGKITSSTTVAVTVH